MPSKQLPEFAGFKKKLQEAARRALIAANPEYVKTFQQRLDDTGGDLERVIEETKPLLGKGLGSWSRLLTALLDFELVLDKVTRSLRFHGTSISGSPEEVGAWVHYHFDHWAFQMDALLERLDKLIAVVFRQLVRPKDSDWRNKERVLRSDVKKMKGSIGKVRHPLAHGLGGGVTGIQDERLWEPFLAGAAFDVDILRPGYERAVPYAKRWHSILVAKTAEQLAATEAIFRQLSTQVP